MFGNFSLPELLIVGAIALIVIGPKDLPRMMRTVGKFVGQARGMARQFQDSMSEAAREADLAEFREARDLLKSKAPTKSITDTFNKALDLDDDKKTTAKPKRSPVLSEEEQAAVAREAGFGGSSGTADEPSQKAATAEPAVTDAKTG